MEGEKDWRREDGQIAAVPDVEEALKMDQAEATAVLENLSEASVTPTQALTEDAEASFSADTPAHYHINDPPSEEPPLPKPPSLRLQAELAKINPSGQWEPTTLTVYARLLVLTTTSPSNGCALLPFPKLCATNLGPADYISICSNFHTLIVTEIPVFTLLQKNEARRFITFLDACYEARCRLLIEAGAPPDRLFFPETRAKRGSRNMLSEGDSIESEAFSEMYQDSTAPFRPNISSYVGPNKDERESVSSSSMSVYNKDLRSVLADEDADFGPTYGNRRSNTGVSSSAADYNYEKAVPDERGGRTPAGMAELEIRQGPDFTQGASVFTGQDEQFAYKRARSRLWEMCGRRWWDERAGRDPRNWWTPVHKEGRFWEKTKEETHTVVASKQGLGEGEGMVMPDGSHDGRSRKADISLPNLSSEEKEKSQFRHGASPFRARADPPPKFGWQHAWGTVTWGGKAGEWGKGVEGRRRTGGEVEDNVKR